MKLRFNQIFSVIGLSLLMVMLGTIAANAQTTSSTLTGRVTLGGDALPGVTVTVSSPSLQGFRTSVTDVNGTYSFGALPPGNYTVKFDMEGMQSVTRTTAIGLSQTGRANAELKLSTVAEAITVTASAPSTLETTEIQTNLQQKQMQELPVQRNVLAVANLAPGVNSNAPSGGQIVISGAPAHENVYIIDGVVANENLRGQYSTLFIEDAVQETTVLTGGISAQYGRFTGGVVNTITKSGGNEFSGSLRDSLSKQNWTAATPLNDPRANKLNSIYEGTLGGRIIRDRLWFFTAGRYAKTSTNSFLTDSVIPFGTATTEKRYEGKLTAAITPKHNVVVTGFHLDVPTAPYCFSSCFEKSNFSAGRNVPQGFYSAHYDGILSNNFLIEGLFSTKTLIFKGEGGPPADFAHGSWAYDLNTGGFFGAPVFCSTCGNEYRNNKYYDAKATYFLGTKSFGTHNIVGGYQKWDELRKANNFQSGSNFGVYTYNTPTRDANGNLTPTFSAGDIILWTPIFQLTKKGSTFQTNSLYVNDKWDLSSHWQFNLGARYDKNHGVDANGLLVAKDSVVSPRIGGIYDVFANNKLRVNASYGRYVAKIAETVGDIGAGAGNPASIYYFYTGPDITGTSTVDAMQQLYNWFQANGGTKRVPDAAVIPGLTNTIVGSLKSPAVNEVTFGVGSQIGKGFVRGDVIHRKWNNFYTTVTSPATSTVTDQFGDVLDHGFTQNSNALSRKYDALLLQGTYSVTNRLTFAGNYTYAKLKGNVTAETGPNGPITESVFSYAEYKNFAQNNPTGYLTSDQRHKARAWVTYDFFGNFVFSALERYDSGTSYSASQQINSAGSWYNCAAGAPCSIGAYVTKNFLPAGFQYQGPPSGVTYYFSGRGQNRWDNVKATDLSLDYRLPLGRAQLYVQPQIVNVFNAHAVISGNTSVTIAKAFNPFTTTPVECPQVQASGANMTSAACRALQGNWFKGANFGKATTPTNYQTPRTYRVSVGARF
jgi:Carboxypeptidase regulatory-like domain/TonB dependent receptor/TonB-dependent Receptor Plug Domain